MAVQNAGIIVKGLPELQRALERTGGGKSNFGLEYELQRRLRIVGEHIAAEAPKYVTHGTGRHGNPELPRLEDTAKVSVTQRRATVFSESPYAAVQNYGGGPKKGWGNRGPHIKRERASRWLTRDVQANRAYVDAEMDGLFGWVQEEWDRGI